MGGPTGLRYEAIYPLLDRETDTPNEWMELFQDVQVLESAALKQMAENRAVQSLPPGVGAVAGHRLALSPDLEVDAIRAQLVHGGYDAALVSRLVSVDTSTTVVPTQTHFMTDPGFWGVGPRYRSFYSIYPYAYTTPAYAVEDTRVIVETLLYRLPEGRPVWTAVDRKSVV